MLYLWDVHSKKWNKKHFEFTAILCEFNASTIGLTFDFHLSKVLPKARMSGDYYAHLNLRFLWIEFLFALDFGNKPKHDAEWKRIRALTKELATQRRSVVD